MSILNKNEIAFLSAIVSAQSISDNQLEETCGEVLKRFLKARDIFEQMNSEEESPSTFWFDRISVKKRFQEG